MRRGLEEQLLVLEDALILALCHLTHEILEIGSSGVGTVSTETGSEAGEYLEPALETHISHQPLPMSPVIRLQHPPLPRPIRNTAVPNQMMAA